MSDPNFTRDDMTLMDFRLMKIESLRDFLAWRKTSTEGDLETLVSRYKYTKCALIFLR